MSVNKIKILIKRGRQILKMRLKRKLIRGRWGRRHSSIPLYSLLALVAAFALAPHYVLTASFSISNDLFSEYFKKNAITEDRNDFVDAPDYVYDIGNTKWMTDDLEKAVKKTLNTSGCLLCDSAEMRQRGQSGKRRRGNSTPRDLIVVSMMRYSYNLETFVRSLRSTGCRARVVIFHDERSLESVNGYMRGLLDACGVILIDIGVIQPRFVAFPYEVRHPWYYKFLLRFRGDFDRVITSDLSDVFFQTDPFTEEFTNRTLQATTELVTLDRCPLNREWVEKSDPYYDPVFYQGRISLCFGLLYGSTNAMLAFYDTFFRTRAWREFKIKTIDQGYLNYYFYRGKFAKRGLHLTATLPNDLIISARGGASKNVTDSETGYVLMDNSVVIPAMIHHYNRICSFISNIKHVCPSENPDKEFAYAKPKETTC